MQETGSGEESDESVGQYHNFTIKEKVLKEILKNVTPQMLSGINEEKSSIQLPPSSANQGAAGNGTKASVKKVKPLLSEALAYSRSPDARPMSPSRFR